MKDCIKGIRQLENNRSDFWKLLQLKLAFSLEQIVSFAKLAYEIEFPEDEKDSNPIGFAVFKFCAECVKTVLRDSNTKVVWIVSVQFLSRFNCLPSSKRQLMYISHIQVQAIGLQVLKSKVQRCTNRNENKVMMFFVGVLVRDIFSLIQMMLKVLFFSFFHSLEKSEQSPFSVFLSLCSVELFLLSFNNDDFE